MALTQEDLDSKQARNAKLREQLEETSQKATARVYEKSLDIQGAQLDAEAARLEAQLAAAKEAAKVSNVNAGAGDLLDQAKEDAKADHDFTPPGVAVDTNPENDKG